MKCCNVVLLIVSLVGLVLLILGAVLGFKVLPDFVDTKVGENVELRNGSDAYDRFIELPFPLNFKVYFFNVKNADGVVNGDKPEVEQIGPIHYAKNQRKEEVVFDEDTNAYTYKQFKEHTFEADLSEIDEDTEITIVNVPLNSIFQIVESLNIDIIMNALVQGYKPAFGLKDDDNPLFHRIKVREYTFDGYEFCKKGDIGTNQHAKALCALLRVLAPESMLIGDERQLKFSFFEHKNNNPDGIYTVHSGLEDAAQVGQILSWNEKKTTNYWMRDGKCNDVVGTDSTLYPPYADEDTVFKVFNTDICRTVDLVYSTENVYKDVDGDQHDIHRDTLNWEVEDNKCYCIKKTKRLDGTLECLPNGFMDMYNCLGAPVVLTFPHLVWADKDYAETVEGLTPVDDDHIVKVTVEPKTGTPLHGNKRIQFNLLLRPLQSITVTDNLKPSVLPILWVDEGVELSNDMIDMLNEQYLSKLPLVEGVKWGLIVIGLAVFVIFLIIFLCRRNK